MLLPPLDPESDPRAGRLRILGWSRASDPAAPDWASEGMPALFAERVHYLRDPVAVAAAGDPDFLATVLEDHWTRCRPGRGAAWRPFPLARRSLNLLRLWAVLEGRGAVTEPLRRELDRHTRVAAALLSVRLERHSRGNHVLTELAALACSARVRGGRPRGVLERLVEEAARQFLGGGGHHERSPRYHLDVVRDLLDVIIAWGDDLPDGPRAGLGRLVTRGVAFGAALSHGDGDVALFNDGALGDGPTWEEIARAATAAGLRVPDPERFVAFPEEGYVVDRRGDRRLLVDCGPPGPPEQAAHAHCDILSFELSDGPRRVVGNRGTSDYSGPGRRATRGTASHSTLQVGDLEQAELVGDFRVGRRAAPELVEASPDRIAGRLTYPDGGVVHERAWTPGTGDDLVVVRDRVKGRGDRGAVARFHLPDATDVAVDGGVSWRVGGRRYSLSAGGGRVRAFASTWHPRPGASRPAWTAEVTLGQDEAVTTIRRSS